jgi:AcrR family transcriptional regulator
MERDVGYDARVTERAARAPKRPPKVKRRTREQYDAARSTLMRQRILDAAFESLRDEGYARTTTVAVCRRAGVPRGTLLHHYSERSALLVAALEHVYERRLEDFRRQIEKLRIDDGPNRLPNAATIQLLWKIVSSGSTTAWIELVVAARTEPSLSRELRRMTRAFDVRIRTAFAELFPGAVPTVESSPGASVPFALALLNGLMLDRLGGLDEHVPEVLSALSALVENLFPEKS